MTVTCGFSTMHVTSASAMSRLLLMRVPGASLHAMAFSISIVLICRRACNRRV